MTLTSLWPLGNSFGVYKETQVSNQSSTKIAPKIWILPTFVTSLMYLAMYLKSMLLVRDLLFFQIICLCLFLSICLSVFVSLSPCACVYLSTCKLWIIIELELRIAVSLPTWALRTKPGTSARPEWTLPPAQKVCYFMTFLCSGHGTATTLERGYLGEPITVSEPYPLISGSRIISLQSSLSEAFLSWPHCHVTQPFSFFREGDWWWSASRRWAWGLGQKSNLSAPVYLLRVWRK